MISAEDCEFIKKFEVANSEEKQAILTAEGHQVNSLFLQLLTLKAVSAVPKHRQTPAPFNVCAVNSCEGNKKVVYPVNCSAVVTECP